VLKLLWPGLMATQWQYYPGTGAIWPLPHFCCKQI